MTMPAIVMPDVELLVTGYLRDALADRTESCCADVHVSTAVPNPRTERMVIVRRDGGRRLDAVRERAFVSMRIFGSTFGECVALANIVRALMQAVPDGKPVLTCEEQSAPSSVVDDSGQPMRYGLFDLTLRGAGLPPVTP